MDDIWQQFHRLPKILRDAVATPQALETITRLERDNPGLDLAGFVMRVMVKEFPLSELGRRLVTEAAVDSATADHLVDDLTRTVFSSSGEYLGIRAMTPVPAAATPTPPSMTQAPVTKTAPPPSNLPPAFMPTPPSPTRMPSAPAPVGAVAPKPSLSPDDEAEIAASAARLRSLNVGQPTDFDAISQQVLQQHQLAFRDDLLSKRAVAILKARLKNIRTAEETTALLMRPPKVGGLGLDPDISTAVTASLEKSVQAAKVRGQTREPEPVMPPPLPRIPPAQTQKPEAMPPLTRDFKTMKPDPAAVEITEQQRLSRPIFRPADIPAPPFMPTGHPPSSVPARPTPMVPQPVPVNAAPSPANQRPRSADRPAVADILPPSSTLGPSEEMRSYSLMQFRRLGQGAGDSAKKLLDKFRHLQEESFSLWAEAIAGWRQSEVYRIYLDIGRQSLDESKSVEQVIQQRAASGQPYLSEHEFNTLADMNRRLQF